MNTRDIMIKAMDENLIVLNNEGPYVIKYNGKRVKMKSGKTCWNTTGAAKNAFHNCIKDYGLTENLREAADKDDYRGSSKEYNRLFNELQKDGTLVIEAAYKESE